MKGFQHLLTLAISVFFLFSCSGEQPEVLGEMNATINGETFSTMATSGELLVNNQDTSQKNLLLSGIISSEGKAITISLTNKADGNDGAPTFSTGLYTLSSDSLNAQLIYSANGINYFNILECEVLISENNPTNSTVKGNFEGLILSASGDTANIQNGTFENVVYRIN